MSGAFVNPLARGMPGPVNKARQIKDWTREILALPDEAVVSVNELACSLPDCPPKETVILVMVLGVPARHASLHMPLRDVRREDLTVALSGFLAG